MSAYDHKKIEKKWQKEWAKKKLYQAKKIGKKSALAREKATTEAPKSYILDMFPYPSGEGLHVGHPKGYIATDIYSRFKRMNGYNVLHPMGWDAFGLPAENYAIKNKIHPRIAVEKNIKRYKEQLSVIGFDYDWSREINTTDPDYYRWTQWIFLKLYEKGLAFQSHEPINWCPSCQTGLANEDVENGICERCGSVVEKRPMRQWVLKITDYADRLLEDLDTKDEKGNALLEWPESIKESQRNWIGRSEGSEINFTIEFAGGQKPGSIPVFTTRPDTIFGVTALIFSPEHIWVTLALDKNHVGVLKNADEVRKYVKEATEKTEIDRTNAANEKTGIKLEGVWAINPANNEKIPVFVADYVIASYGTGAIMAVPAGDERDLAFAKKYNVPVKSFKMPADEIKKVTDKITKKTVKYKLRDWVFSRQRYWGEPIPMIHCEKCGTVPVPEKDLPVRLPEVKHYEPTGTGESPLAAIEKWVNVKCPKCGSKAKRETNTMPQWAGSSWYYLRYMDPKNKKVLVDPATEKYWEPVDMYVGGAEHATRHLIYARFWHKFLYDIGVTTTIEPFKRYTYVGLILAADGRKMSKRFGNVVNPDEIVETYGADTLRVYEMFMGPFTQSISWDTKSIIGSRRFIEKIWRISEKVEGFDKSSRMAIAPHNPILRELSHPSTNIETLHHKTIKKVTEDIENFNFNTAISSMMMLSNELEKMEKIPAETFAIVLKLLAPFAPHVTDELWKALGNKKSIHISAWPTYDPAKLSEKTATIAIQINGKVRGEIIVDSNEQDEAVKERAMNLEITKKWLEGRPVKKVIYVKNRLVNIVG
jgi:leucyl-tRNA synthetase